VQEFTAEEIIEGIQNRDTNVLDYVYENFFYQIKVFISKNSGSDEDAQDIYQDAILVIYQKIMRENLTLNSSFSTYLYSVCRLLWLKQLEQKKLKTMFMEDTSKFVELDDGITDVHKPPATRIKSQI